MTQETLLEMKEKIDKAESIQHRITDLKKILDRRSEIKLFGVCAYFDEELEDMLYAELPEEASKRFLNEIIMEEINRLESEFAVL